MDDDDDLLAMEASMRRRKLLARVIYGAVIAAPLVVIGMCVREGVREATRPSETVTLPEDEMRAAVEISRAHRASVGLTDPFTAPAAILAQLRGGVAPGADACPIALRARSADVSHFEAPAFLVTQLTAQELAAAPAADVPARDDLEVVFVIAHRRRPFSSGVAFTPGDVSGRAYLWDHARNRIACAGDVSAQSSPAVQVQRATIDGAEVMATGAGDSAILSADLDRQLERAIATGLHAAR